MIPSNEHRHPTFGILTILLCVVAAIVLYGNTRSHRCNVAVVHLTGYLFTHIDPTDTKEEQASSEAINRMLETAAANPRIKAIVLSVDSGGGAPAAGESVFHELKSIHKPTVVVALSEDMSAAYMASLGADTIFAENTSGVGDIGATASYVDFSLQDQFQGVTFNQLSIGAYKDMGNQDKPLTEKERVLQLSQLREIYDLFVRMVAENRHMTLAAAQALANGAPYPGLEAVKNGLVDHIGGMREAQQYLTHQLGRQAVLCE